MNLKIFLVMGFQLLFCHQLIAQKLVVKLDGEVIKPKTVYEYFPHYYHVEVVNGSKNYVIVKGTASLVKNGRKLSTTSIAGGQTVFPVEDKYLLPGSRLVIEVQEIGDPQSRQSSKTNYVFAVAFNAELMSKPHPHYKLLINSSEDFFSNGIDPSLVETIEFVYGEEYSPARISIYHVRGRRLMQEQKFSSVEQAVAGLKEMMKDASALTGDRMVVEFVGRKGAFFTIHINRD